jgi:hypothetical protein
MPRQWEERHEDKNPREVIQSIIVNNIICSETGKYQINTVDFRPFFHQMPEKVPAEAFGHATWPRTRGCAAAMPVAMPEKMCLAASSQNDDFFSSV